VSKIFGHTALLFGRWSLRFVAVCVLLCFVAAPVFVWRVHTSPFDIGFAKDYVQAALYDRETGNHVQLDRVVLFWPDLKGPLYIQIKDAQLLNKENFALVSIGKAAFSFSRQGLLVGRVLPKEIVLQEPILRLSRDAQGGFDFSLGVHSDPEFDEEKHEITTRIFGYLARPGYENAHDSLISRLEAFRIENARLLIDDQLIQQTWSLPDFNAGFKSTGDGMTGYAQVSLPSSGLDDSSLSIDLNYLWDQKNVEISADLTAFDLGALAHYVPEMGMISNQEVLADAHVEVLLNERFIPEDVRVNLTSDQGSILHADLSLEPVPYQNLVLQASYNYAGKSLRVHDTQITLKDVTVNASADIEHTETLVRGPVKVWIDEVQQEQIDPLWPQILRGDSSEEWIVQKMSKGVLKDVWAKLDLVVEKKVDEVSGESVWDFDAQNVEAEFAAEGMTVNYRAPLPIATDVQGTGRFDLNTDILSIDITRGKIGDMSIGESRLVFDEVAAVGAGGADLDIALRGKNADILRYISGEPINLKDEINMDLAQVRGDADLKVGLNFPTNGDVKLKDFQIDVDGTLKNVNIPDVIDTLDLSGGPFDLSLHDGLVKLSGKTAMLDKRPMEFSWKTFLESKGKPYKEKITAKITADPNICTQLGIDLSDFIEGSLPIDVTYALYRDGTAKADIRADVTNALFFVDPFDYEKKPGEAAEAQFTAFFKNKDLQKISHLQAKAGEFSVSDAQLWFKQVDGRTELLKADFPVFSLEETKGKLGFSFDDKGAVNIVLDAEFLDVQAFMEAEDNGEEYAEPPMKISVTAKAMRTAPEEVVHDARMFYDIDDQGRFNQMEMDAKVGTGGVFARFKPDAQGKNIFHMRSDDAGAMLKAFQVYDNIRGGEMTIYGEPIDGVFDRNIKGQAEITNFKVIKAPALTKVLSILSLTGIGEALTSNGLSFTKLESDFRWLYRKNGSLLVLKEGRTSGNSLGLLFSGTFDNAARRVDVSGTVVPMSGLNGFIGRIPLVGDILTGGSGGVFAATYSVRGSSEEPVISVNPLSVLTPGIIRRILFE